MGKSDTHGTFGARIEVTERGSDSRVERSTLSAGGVIAEHTHDVDVRFVIVSGNGRLTGKHKQDLGAGDSVVVPAGQPHGWENGGTDDFALIGIFPSHAAKNGVHFEDAAYGAEMSVQRSLVAPNGAIADHVHGVASSFVVISGSGKLTGDKSRDVAAGDVVHVAAGQKHGWAASGTGPLSIVGTFTPASLSTRGVGIEVLESAKNIRIERSTISHGGSIAEHAHDVTSSFVVVSGSGQLTGDSPKAVRSGDAVVIRAGELHGWRNTGPESLQIVGTFAVRE